MTSMPNQFDLEGPDFIVFSDDWGEHPSSCQHIFRHIAKDHRVLWVNTIGMRNPTFTFRDARKVVRKATKMFDSRNSASGARHLGGRITVCQPLMLPGIRWPMVRRFNARSVTNAVTSLLQANKFGDPIIVTTVPNFSEYPELIEDHKVVYYCVDDFTLWPGLDAELVREMESRLIARADCLIAVSEVLCERLKISGKPVHLLTHGVDVDLFSTHSEHIHSTLNSIQAPRVGFFGLIDGRMDWDLVVSLTKMMPEFAFVFAGPVDASAGPLPHATNLHFLGSIGYAELPKFTCGIDALILPYKANGLGKVLSPLKLKEYLATGKPVISAPVGAIEDWMDTISVAHTHGEWAEYLGKAVGPSAGHRSPVTSEHLRRHSWDAKATEFLSICSRNLDKAAIVSEYLPAAAP